MQVAQTAGDTSAEADCTCTYPCSAALCVTPDIMAICLSNQPVYVWLFQAAREGILADLLAMREEVFNDKMQVRERHVHTGRPVLSSAQYGTCKWAALACTPALLAVIGTSLAQHSSNTACLTFCPCRPRCLAL